MTVLYIDLRLKQGKIGKLSFDPWVFHTWAIPCVSVRSIALAADASTSPPPDTAVHWGGLKSSVYFSVFCKHCHEPDPQVPDLMCFCKILVF